MGFSRQEGMNKESCFCSRLMPWGAEPSPIPWLCWGLCVGRRLDQVTLWPAELDVRPPGWLVLAGTHPEDTCQAMVSIWVGCQKPRHIAEGLPLQAYPVPPQDLEVPS